MNVLVEQRGVRTVQVARRLIIEVGGAVVPGTEEFQRLLATVDEDYGPFRYSTVRHTERIAIETTRILGTTQRRPDVPLRWAGIRYEID